MLSEDDVDIRGLTPEELDAAWDLWFDLAQSTNDADLPYTHGVFAGSTAGASVRTAAAGLPSSDAETLHRPPSVAVHSQPAVAWSVVGERSSTGASLGFEQNHRTG